MADPAKQLKNKFEPQHRYSNFGPILSKMQICGFRGIDDMPIAFESPITAFSGLNGAGKSTVGQLAVCAYRKVSTTIGCKRFYVKDFFPVSAADPNPFRADARVEYSFETSQLNAPQTVTVSRQQREWSGYKRQPERSCFYVGFTLYIPKVERRDLSIYRGSLIELRDTRPIPDDVRAKVGLILNQPYDELLFQGIGHKTKEVELGIAKRHGAQYSENNMGFGEGRVLYMVDLLESVPEQSLFMLEEPETSLHEDAQYQLAKYFMDVCNRRHHQLILSTHSSVILDALPAESRKLLVRDAAGVTEYPNISATRARAILSGGQQRGLTICVEDDFAKLVLRELIRRADASLLKAVSIEPLGGNNAVRNGLNLLDKLGLNAIGVRDADTGPDPGNKLYSLPGTKCPELEVFECDAVVDDLKESYAIDIVDFRALHPDIDAHDLPRCLAKDAEILEDALSTQAARAYVMALPDETFEALIQTIRDNA